MQRDEDLRAAIEAAVLEAVIQDRQVEIAGSRTKAMHKHVVGITRNGRPVELGREAAASRGIIHTTYALLDLAIGAVNADLGVVARAAGVGIAVVTGRGGHRVAGAHDGVPHARSRHAGSAVD